MQMEVSKSWQFSAAHSNPFHPGECSRIHGHTYTVRVWARGPVQTDGGDEHGMVVDFRRLSDAVREHVLEPFDHQFLNDVIGEHTTVETLAGLILHRLVKDVPEVCRVRVYEGPTAYAEATIDPSPAQLFDALREWASGTATNIEAWQDNLVKALKRGLS